MTADEAIRYIESHGLSREKKGLDNEKKLLKLLGDPEKKLRYIHVAGSNGKGSTCAMFASILKECGYKTGLFISPHLIRYNERISINGQDIPDNELSLAMDRVKEAEEEMGVALSQFEILTAAAFLYFAKESCDIAVLEVGMGGEYDPTNVIDAPLLSVITNIGLEHTKYLGNTLSEIAHTKAGIIKEGSPCICYDALDKEVLEVIEKICEDRKAPLTVADHSQIEPVSESFNGQIFKWRGETYEIPLVGEYQLHNVATVLTGMEILAESGVRINTETGAGTCESTDTDSGASYIDTETGRDIRITTAAIREGLKKVHWPARMEILSTDPLFILDGGHNPQCMKALSESLRKLVPGKDIVFLIGVLQDKDYPEMAAEILPIAKGFVCVTPDSDRSVNADTLSEYLKSKNVTAVSEKSIKEAVRTAVKMAGVGGCIVALGSLYLAGEIRREAEELSECF
ncbi:MAG: bifunctional folylpolyglutamate synthase/dihydrofolate synthase [Lachnospiraceae bacterium]|nr:bifunctional folylpolyglutamate synthase/dihydrofolate synthase [Lachnospiraceae bacterium]